MLISERYYLQKRIGHGRYCQTFLALDQSQSPPIPCIIQELPQDSPIPLKFEELGKHPQIPQSLAYFPENQSFYWVQEFIQGINLAILLSEQGAFSETQIWQLLGNILPVIQFIHDRQIIHRDIQPENIIFRHRLESDFVLVDFSTAQLTTQMNDVSYLGNPEYSAPEQTRGKAVFSSDLYSLGVTCIHLLTEIPPFDLFDLVNNNWAWRSYLSTQVSDRLAKVLDKLLENNIPDRFSSAEAVIQAMGIKSIPKTTITPSPWRCVSTLTSHVGKLASVNALAFSPQGKILASGGDDKCLKIWDVATQQLITNITAHTQALKSIAFSPDGKILATASDDQTLKLWNGETFQEITTLVGHTHAIKTIAFSPDGKTLASGSWDKTVKIWDLERHQELSTLTGPQLQVSAIAFHPQGKILASASYDRCIYLWEELQNRPCYTLIGILSGHAWAVLAVAFSPNGKILATGSDDNTIKLWDVSTGQLIRTLLGHSWSVVGLAFATDTETLISASWDQTVKLWNVNTAEEMGTLSGHTNSVSTIAVNPITQLIASGSRDQTIKLWQFVKQQNS